MNENVKLTSIHLCIYFSFNIKTLKFHIKNKINNNNTSINKEKYQAYSFQKQKHVSIS